MKWMQPCRSCSAMLSSVQLANSLYDKLHPPVTKRHQVLMSTKWQGLFVRKGGCDTKRPFGTLMQHATYRLTFGT